MRYPLVHIDQPLAADLRRGVVITPTSHLAAELRYCYNYRRFERNRRSWPSPSVLSYAQWVSTEYRRLGCDGIDTAERALIAGEAMFIAARLASDDVDVARHTSEFLQAWDLSWDWNLRTEWHDLRTTEDGRTFEQWADRFQKFLDDRNQTTTAQLTGALERAASLDQWKPSDFTLFGFDRLTRSQVSLFSVLEAKGVEIRKSFSKHETTSAPKRVRFETTQNELAAVAYWAREYLLKRPKRCRVGVVLPSIRQHYSKIRRQFEAVFPDVENIEQVVQIGSGRPLNDCPLVQAVLTFLEWTVRPLQFNEIEHLACSRFLPGLEIPTEYPASLPLQCSLQEFAEWRDSSETISAISELLRPTREPHPIHYWTSLLRNILRRAQWSENVDEEDQVFAYNQFVKVINASQVAEAFSTEITWEAAVRTITHMANESTCPHSTEHAPVQVIRRDQSPYLSFDAVWVTQMAVADWPQAPTPNPLLPARMQREAQIPGVTYVDKLDEARTLTNTWVKSAPEVIFSYCEEVEETEAEPSFLISDFKAVDPDGIVQDDSLIHHSHIWAEHQQQDQFEYIEDSHGSEVDLSTERSHGTSLVRDISHCPFRSWAIHRLGLRPPESIGTLFGALERGTIVHNILQQLTTGFPDRDAIAGITDDDINNAIDEVLDRDASEQPLRFLQHEHERIAAILHAWRACESTRDQFTVAEVESAFSAEIAGVSFNMRVDRIDDLGNGRKLIIDYKTGRTQLSNWDGEYPKEPQLPMYSSLDDDVAAVAFLEVNEDKPAFKGYREEDLAPILGITAPESVDFDGKRKEWRSVVEALIEDYIHGDARVTPRHSDSCRYCHLESFCRVFEE